MSVILGIDAGNYMVKVVGDHGVIKFHSTIGESRKLNLEQVHGEDDMFFEYKNIKGFAGTLAMFESEFAGSIMGDSKAHSDTKLRILLAIHKYLTTFKLQQNQFEIIVGQPISKHYKYEKDKIKNMIKGKHTIKVNGIEKSFEILNVEVAAECASAYWSNPSEGLVRIIDIGSGTVNFATILDGRYIDKDSNTVPFGADTNKTSNLESLSRGVAVNCLKKWSYEDQVFIIGGIAERIQPHLTNFFKNIKVLYPIYKQQCHNPIFANAIGFHMIGVSLYE